MAMHNPVRACQRALALGRRPKTVSDDLIGDRIHDVSYVNLVHNVATQIAIWHRTALEKPISQRASRTPSPSANIRFGVQELLHTTMLDGRAWWPGSKVPATGMTLTPDVPPPPTGTRTQLVRDFGAAQTPLRELVRRIPISAAVVGGRRTWTSRSRSSTIGQSIDGLFRLASPPDCALTWCAQRRAVGETAQCFDEDRGVRPGKCP